MQSINMIEIPSASFQMGSLLTQPNIHQDETPLHNVHVPTFFISLYPVTNEAYALFIANAAYKAPPHWQNSKPSHSKLAHPVVNVSHADAQAYCEWLTLKEKVSYRLPTEKEWEKAARGTTDERMYSWGDEWAGFCNSKENGRLDTTPVTRYTTYQKNPYGIADMLGNVWEWTDSWYERYPASQHFSVNFGQSHKIVRGGSYRNDKFACRVSKRGRYMPDICRPYLGFRIASTDWKSPPPEPPSKPATEKKTPINTQLDLPTLVSKVANYFDLSELKKLTYALSLNYEEFPDSEALSGMARELVEACRRREILPNLLNLLEKERPNITWK